MSSYSKDQEKKKDERQEEAQVAAAKKENPTLHGALRPREGDNDGSKEAMATGESMTCLFSGSRVVLDCF